MLDLNYISPNKNFTNVVSGYQKELCRRRALKLSEDNQYGLVVEKESAGYENDVRFNIVKYDNNGKIIDFMDYESDDEDDVEDLIQTWNKLVKGILNWNVKPLIGVRFSDARESFEDSNQKAIIQVTFYPSNSWDSPYLRYSEIRNAWVLTTDPVKRTKDVVLKIFDSSLNLDDVKKEIISTINDIVEQADKNALPIPEFNEQQQKSINYVLNKLNK